VSANTPSIKHRRFNTPYLLPNTPASTRDHDQKPLIVPAPVASIVGSYPIFVNRWNSVGRFHAMLDA
jgi:hypothetical protein